MKQLFQQMDTGETKLLDVPAPAANTAGIVVETRASVISAGTERMLVDFAKSNWIEKARKQPDKVKQVIDKVRTDGLAPTLQSVRAKLQDPIPLGYCNAGVVTDLGARATGSFRVGDRVVTNGPHAEFVRVPMTLAARIPECVSYESAAFTPLAAIALQGIRLAKLTLGETVVVYGLGLIGLLTIQLVRATGCRAIGVDRDLKRGEIANGFGADTIIGAENVVDEVIALTNGVGADAVLMTLASESDDPMHQAALMSRKRGRIVLVGVTGLRLNRDDFYKKELSFSVSCSYGPGRYDPSYEEQGNDYPLPFVRWTEQRNFQAILTLMAEGRLDPSSLISHRFPLTKVQEAYELVTGNEPSLGIVLTYGVDDRDSPSQTNRTIKRRPRNGGGQNSVGVIGAGNYASRVILPALRDAGFDVTVIASTAGTTAAIAGERFDAERVTTDIQEVLLDASVESVFVLTRHDSHSTFAKRALEAGKNVFVEKPLALRLEDLDELEIAARQASGILTVGFNRRFAPLTRESQKLLRSRVGPLSVVATVNAGPIPREHWTQDADVGGGRVVGEAVHWIDLARALVGDPIVRLNVVSARDRLGAPVDDIVHLSLQFADGSTAVIHYLSTGSKAYPKERIECFFDGKIIAIDNWRRLRRFGLRRPLFQRTMRIDKGQDAEIRTWKEALRTGVPPIPLEEIFEVSRFAIRAAELARAGGGSTS